MNKKLFCILCGGTLHPREEEMECSECGCSYNDLLISESIEEAANLKIIEISISAGATLRKPIQVPVLNVLGINTLPKPLMIAAAEV